MATIKNTAKISGKGLMKGIECNVNILPSQEKGIRFYVGDSKAPIVANYKNVVSTDNCVVLTNNEKSMVMLVEHFMAACAFAEIDSMDVHIDSPELPILDGSAYEWHKLFNDAGIEQNNCLEQISFEKPIAISKGKTDIILIPADEFKITYCINFDHPELQNSWVSFDLSQDNSQIIESRTFGYLKDLERFQQAGMALGVTPKNTVGLTESGYTVELRSKFEPVKHKILDIIGDLSLTGLNPLGFKAHIIAKEAGHKSHVEFATIIINELKHTFV